MSEYSIEEIVSRIFETKTKEYMKEVVSSYYNGNCRSAVVMLWSVLICDLVFKLNYLKEFYSDSNAIEILNEIESIQQAEPNSPRWETVTINQIKQKTNLLEVTDIAYIEHLNKIRNLSAHPILTSSLELSNPTKETTRSLIIEITEGILIKPPFLSRKIFDGFLQDLSHFAVAQHDENGLERFLNEKYFSKLQNYVIEKIFRSLWKLIVFTSNNECDNFRAINFSALKIIYNKYENHLFSSMKNEIDYFSQIALPGSTDTRHIFLVMFLASYPKIYLEILNDSAKVIVETTIRTNNFCKLIGWFLKNSFSEHLEEILEWVKSGDILGLEYVHFNTLRDLTILYSKHDYFLKIISSYYSYSPDYNEGDKRFEIIRANLQNYDKEGLLYLLNEIENGYSGQTCDRRRASNDHYYLKNRCVELLGDQFDLSGFRAFRRY